MGGARKGFPFLGEISLDPAIPTWFPLRPGAGRGNKPILVVLSNRQHLRTMQSKMMSLDLLGAAF